MFAKAGRVSRLFQNAVHSRPLQRPCSTSTWMHSPSVWPARAGRQIVGRAKVCQSVLPPWTEEHLTTSLMLFFVHHLRIIIEKVQNMEDYYQNTEEGCLIYTSIWPRRTSDARTPPPVFRYTLKEVGPRGRVPSVCSRRFRWTIRYA